MTDTRFNSLAELQARHAELVRQVGRRVVEGKNPAVIARFVNRAVATGAVLDAKEDRAAAQGLIGYWTSRLATAGREFARALRREEVYSTDGTDSSTATAVASAEIGDTLLADYEPAAMADVAAGAARVVDELPAADRVVAKRLLLRLVQLRPDEPVFDPVPAPLPSLYSRGDSIEQVDRLVRRLDAAGLLRVSPPDAAGVAWVALRSPEVMTRWDTFKGWMDERLQVRRRAAEWHARTQEGPGTGGWSMRALRLLSAVGAQISRVGRAAAKLIPAGWWPRALTGDLLAGPALEDARRYHDRTEVERQFLEASRAREQLTNDRNRAFMGLFGLMAVFAAVGWLSAAAGLWRARQETDRTKQALDDLAIQEHAVSEKEKDRAARERLSALRLLVRDQARVIIARTLPEKDIALHAWDQLVPQLPRDFLTPKKLGDLRGQAADVQSQGCLCRSPDYSIDEIHHLRDEVVQRADTLRTLRGIRDVSFSMVEKSVDEIVKEFAKPNPSYTEVMPYVDEFWTQYWGEMLLVEDTPVKNAMITFGEALNQVRDFAVRPAPPVQSPPPPAAKPPAPTTSPTAAPTSPPRTTAPRPAEAGGPRPTMPRPSQPGSARPGYGSAPPAAAPQPAPAPPPPVTLSPESRALLEKAKGLPLDELDRLSRAIRERKVPDYSIRQLTAAGKALNEALAAERSGPLPGQMPSELPSPPE